MFKLLSEEFWIRVPSVMVEEVLLVDPRLVYFFQDLGMHRVEISSTHA